VVQESLTPVFRPGEKETKIYGVLTQISKQFQINLNKQISITKLLRSLNFGVWDLFGIWNLELGFWS
jgi:hypothetical protein